MAWVRKKCSRCKAEKPASDFSREAARRDGYCTKCRQCNSELAASYRLRNRDAVMARERAFYAANPSAARAKSRSFYRAHTVAERKRSDAFRRGNPLVYRAAEAKRRATMKRTSVERIDYGHIMQRDSMRCHICGLSVSVRELEFDHVIPLSKGGPHIESNLAVSHMRCNRSKGARLLSVAP